MVNGKEELKELVITAAQEEVLVVLIMEIQFLLIVTLMEVVSVI
jgi:hypothetical protein